MVAQLIPTSGVNPVQERHQFSRRNPETGEDITTVFALVDCGNLRLDTYQRPISKSKVAQIVVSFDDVAAGALLVNERPDGSLFVFDGQQRLTAIRQIGRKTALCMVFRGLTRHQEAEAFEHCNQVRTHMAANDRFRSRLVREDSQAQEIADIVHQLGMKLDIETEKNGAGIRCVGTLDMIAAKYGIDALRFILSLIRQAWPGESESAYTQQVLTAFAGLVLGERYKAYSLKDLVRRFQRRSLHDMVTRGNVSARINGESGTTALARLLRDALD